MAESLQSDIDVGIWSRDLYCESRDKTSRWIAGSSEPRIRGYHKR